MIKRTPLKRAYVFLPLVVVCIVISPRTSIGQPPAEFKDSDKTAVEALLDRYIHAYSTKDYAALRACLQAPFVRFPEGGWETLRTLDDVMTYYRDQRDALDKDNYDHSTFIRSKLTVLSAERVLVDRVYRRYRKDGSLLLEAATVYVGCKSTGTWKICGGFAHDVKEFEKSY
jgi:hypothetical protein